MTLKKELKNTKNTKRISVYSFRLEWQSNTGAQKERAETVDVAVATYVDFLDDQ